METLLTTLLPVIGPGGVGILAAIIVYFKIAGQRKETKNQRDEDYKLMEYRIAQLEQSQTSLTNSIVELQKSIVSLQISVNELVIEIKHLSKEG